MPPGSATLSLRCDFVYIRHIQAGPLEALFDQHAKAVAGHALVEDIRKITHYVLFAVRAGGDGVQISGPLVESHFVSHRLISGTDDGNDQADEDAYQQPDKFFEMVG